MSDEQPPPLSLRLKPRADPAPTPAPPLPAPPPPPAPTEAAATIEQTEPPSAQPSATEPMKFRLKPKVPPPEVSQAETPLPFSNPPIPAAPAISPAAAIPPVPDADLPPPTPPIATPRPPSAKPTPVFRPPTSLMTPQHLPTPRSLSDLPPSSPPPPAPLPTSAPPERTIKADKWLAGVVVLVLVLAGATYGVRALFKANPKPKAVGKPAAAVNEEKPANPDSGAATATPAKPLPGSQAKLVEKPTSAAGKAIAQARDTVAAVEQRERTAGTRDLLNEPAPTAPTAPAVPERPQNILTPNTPPRTPIVEEVPVAQAEPAVPPSAPFRQFVVNLRVNGVFQGENPRAMLNGRMYNVGAEVDPKLAITLFKIEPEAKLLIFRDDTGAVLSRRY